MGSRTMELCVVKLGMDEPMMFKIQLNQWSWTEMEQYSDVNID